jgi:hypothetical protein
MSVPRLAPGSAGRRVAVVLLLLVVVVLDAVLVLAAFNRVGDVPQAASAPPATHEASSKPTEQPEEQEESDEPAEESPQVDEEAAPARRFLSALSADGAWRTTAGSCPDGAIVAEFTSDGGATWHPHDVTAATGAAQALRIEAVDLDYAFLVTLDQANCGPQFSATYTGGDAWEAYTDERLVGAWFLRPDSPDFVVSPAGRQAAPCSAAALASRSEVEAALLCVDQRVFRTFDGGLSWDDGVEIAGALAIADAPDGYVVASTGVEECDGVGVLSLPNTDSDEAAELGCADVRGKPGEVAVAAAEGAIWLWAADEMARSLDGGKTWG